MKKIVIGLFLIGLFYCNTCWAKECHIIDIQNHWAFENIERMIINGTAFAFVI